MWLSQGWERAAGWCFSPAACASFAARIRAWVLDVRAAQCRRQGYMCSFLFFPETKLRPSPCMRAYTRRESFLTPGTLHAGAFLGRAWCLRRASPDRAAVACSAQSSPAIGEGMCSWRRKRQGRDGDGRPGSRGQAVGVTAGLSAYSVHTCRFPIVSLFRGTQSALLVCKPTGPSPHMAGTGF